MIDQKWINWAASETPKEHPYLNSMPHADIPYYSFLYYLSRAYDEDIDFVVVLGVREAVCCAHICEGLTDNPAAVVLGIDHTIRREAEQVNREYPGKLMLYQGKSPVSLALMSRLRRPIDMVFFDTIHTYRQVKAEFEALEPRLEDNALLIFDDAKGGVLKAIDEIPGKYYELDHLHPGYGFGVKIYSNQ